MTPDTQSFTSSHTTRQAVAVIMMLFAFIHSAHTANFWDTQSLISNGRHHLLKSPPARDTSGTVVAAWETHYRHYTTNTDTTSPQVHVAASPDNGSTWTVRNIRSTPAATDVSDLSPVVVTDKAGNWVCIWSSNDTLGGTSGSDFDILYSTSTDSGDTWSAPQPLNSTALTDTGVDTDPWIAMDETGSCIAAWTSENDPSNVSGSTVTQSTIWLARSPDAGQTWTTAEPWSAAPGHSLSEARIASTGEGNFGMSWVARDTQTSAAVYFASTRNAGATWTAPTSPADSIAPPSQSVTIIPAEGDLELAIAGDPSGRWMLAWNAKLPSSETVDIFFARSPDNGSTWLAPVNMTHADSRRPSLYCDDEGLWYLGLDRPSNSLIAVSKNFGDSWQAAPAFPKTAPTQPYPIPEPAESTPYVWRTGETEWTAFYGKAPVGSITYGSYRLVQAKTTMAPVPPVSSEWSPATSFSGSGPVFGTQPEIAANDSNIWISVYVMPAPQGSSDTEIGFSRSTDGGKTWSAPEVLNPDAAATTHTESLPTIAASDGSTWVCAWQRSDGKIWMARSSDNGDTWSNPGPVQFADGTHLTAVQPSITSLGGEEWLLAYVGAGAIRSVKSTNNGSTWGAPVFVQTSWMNGTCGNTTPCTDNSIYGPPRAFAAHGQSALFVGFNLHVTNRPGGYSRPVESSDQTVGHLAPGGGTSYYGNSHFVGGGLRPSFIGSPEMATDGAGNWRYAERSRYNNAPSWDIEFVSINNIDRFDSGGAQFNRYHLPAVQGRTYDFGTVAMDETSTEFRIWRGVQAYELASNSQLLYFSKSEDSGVTWSEEQLLPTTNPWGAASIKNLRVKGSATSSFVAVWESSLPSGEPVILYSGNNRHNSFTNAKDWQLYN